MARVIWRGHESEAALNAALQLHIVQRQLIRVTHRSIAIGVQSMDRRHPLAKRRSLMKITLASLLCLALILTACGREAAPTATNPPAAPTTGGETAPPVPTEAPPAATEPPTEPPTEAPPAAETPTEAPTEAPSETPTTAPTTVSGPRPTATSSGPLDFQFYIAGCKRMPTAEKPNNAIITISVEATGGNGVYTYVHAGVTEPDKFIDVEWQLGTGLIGKVTVTSAGQSLEKEYFFETTNLECSP
jgi:hypothetical protein